LTSYSGILGVGGHRHLSHHTEEIDTKRLIVRRGQPFSMTIQCRDVSRLQMAGSLEIILHTGKEDFIQIQVPQSEVETDSWWFSLQAGPQDILLNVYSPAIATVGQYKMTVLCLRQGQVLQQLSGGNFLLLFNPWCKDDPVYLPQQQMLQEYILNENGILFQGSWNNIYSVPWNFGQFEREMVDICFEILDNSPAALDDPISDAYKRNDPVYVSRTVSAMINANDDRGVILGRWDGRYEKGVIPTRWTGSVEILRRWSQAGMKPVCYGQCWVFAGVACTVMRCLGIPARCVTNYLSAHDTDSNLRVDRYYNESMELLPGKEKDSIWNYHCWVESWMCRHDLPIGFDGWQVLDPTPQQRSEGIYCCGPCPVKAVKEGRIDLDYDAPFVFAEVNADVVCWIVHEDGRQTQSSLQCRNVGKCISTKGLSGDTRWDITGEYKYPEGSAMEREVYTRAGLRNSLRKSGGQSLVLKMKDMQAIHGSDFDVFVEVLNRSSEDKDITLTVVARAVTYNGIHLYELERKESSFCAQAYRAKKEPLRLKYENYGHRLSEHNLIRISSLLRQVGHSEMIVHESVISLVMPQLTVKIVGEPVLFQKLTALITFVNPLPITLSGGTFTIEGAGLTGLQEIHIPGAIKAGQQVVVSVSFQPTKPGLRKLLVDFETDRLKDIKGSTFVIIQGDVHTSQFSLLNNESTAKPGH
uniref:protein-glutamine gamma-glutamyltransferase n=1 Tax=Erpetoichthys calabaricus TaxID=27687 RepID=A0A8C4S026_ERPCA